MVGPTQKHNLGVRDVTGMVSAMLGTSTHTSQRTVPNVGSKMPRLARVRATRVRDGTVYEWLGEGTEARINAEHIQELVDAQKDEVLPFEFVILGRCCACNRTRIQKVRDL